MLVKLAHSYVMADRVESIDDGEDLLSSSGAPYWARVVTVSGAIHLAGRTTSKEGAIEMRDRLAEQVDFLCSAKIAGGG